MLQVAVTGEQTAAQLPVVLVPVTVPIPAPQASTPVQESPTHTVERIGALPRVAPPGPVQVYGGQATAQVPVVLVPVTLAGAVAGRLVVPQLSLQVADAQQVTP